MRIESWIQDVRVGWRTFARRPAFSFIAASSLALGIALVATQFSLIDGILLRGLPISGAERLVHIAFQDPRSTDPANWFSVSYRDYLVFRERQTGFEALAGVNEQAVNLSGAGRIPSNHPGAYSSANLIEVLGVPPMLGRWFTVEEDQPGKPLLIVLSYGLWKDEFGGDAAVLGRPLNVNGEAGTIIGIMPPRFSFPQVEKVWTNLRASPTSDPRVRLVERVEMVGKVRPGVPLAQARAQLDAIAVRLARQWPETNHGYERLNVQKFAAAYMGNSSTVLYLMLAMTLFILVLACVNVANMLLGRASQRTRELGVRAAVGANRARLVRQLMVESLLLAGLGALAGLALTRYGVELLQENVVQKMTVPGWFDFRLDGRVVAIAVAATLGAGVLAGIVPAWKASRVDVNTALKDDSRAAAGLGLGRLTRWLVIAQIAFSTMLLVGTMVMAFTVYETRRANLRYDPDRLLIGRIEVQEGTQPTTEARARFYRRLLDQLETVPGVDTVAVTSRDFVGNGVPTRVAPEGAVYAHDNDRPTVWLEVVSRRYFDLVGVKPIAGRVFDGRDEMVPMAGSEAPARPEQGAERGLRSAPGAAAPLRTAVVNESFARKFWPKGNALGQRFRSNQTSEQWVTVVGVVPDLQMQGIFAPAEGNQAGFYLPQDQMGWGWLFVFIRTRADPLGLVTPVRQAVASIDPNQPIHSIGTLASQTALAVRGFSILGLMALIFACITLFLGALGVYGVTSQSVSRRTREFGVRMALGSSVDQVLRLVLLQGSRQIALGIGVGLVAGFFLTRPLQGIFGPQVTNNAIFYVVVAVLIVGVGLLALWIPARRAAHIDPMVALRAE